MWAAGLLIDLIIYFIKIYILVYFPNFFTFKVRPLNRVRHLFKKKGKKSGKNYI